MSSTKTNVISRNQHFRNGVAFVMRVSQEMQYPEGESFFRDDEILCRAYVCQEPHFRLGVLHGISLLQP